MYGSKSWSWCRSTLAYAALKSKCDASIVVTRLHAVSAGGVTFCQLLPSFVVTWINPSSVPTQTIGTSSGDGRDRVDDAALAVAMPSVLYVSAAPRRASTALPDPAA